MSLLDTHTVLMTLEVHNTKCLHQIQVSPIKSGHTCRSLDLINVTIPSVSYLDWHMCRYPDLTEAPMRFKTPAGTSVTMWQWYNVTFSVQTWRPAPHSIKHPWGSFMITISIKIVFVSLSGILPNKRTKMRLFKILFVSHYFEKWFLNMHSHMSTNHFT